MAATAALQKQDGFVEIPQVEHRRIHGRRAISQGNERTCPQDAALAVGRDLNMGFTKEDVYGATLPAEGNTEIGAIVDFVQDHGATMESIMDELAHMPGGLAYAVLQLNQVGPHSPLCPCT